MAKEILGYHVYTTRDGGLWLTEDEKTWSSRFNESQSFGNADIATDIGEREGTHPNDTIYVFACMGS